MDHFFIACNLACWIIAVGTAICLWLYFGKRAGWSMVSGAAAFMVWLALLALQYPRQGAVDGELERLVLAALESLRYFTLDHVFELLSDADITEFTQQYYTVEIILSGAAPVCTAAFVFSFLQMAGKAKRFLLPWRPMYYFSELNEKSLTLAENILTSRKKQRRRKPILVFCKAASRDDGDDGEELSFRSKARKLGAVFYRDPIHIIPKANPWLREVKVFLIDTDESANMTTALNMKEWISAPGMIDPSPWKTDSDLLIFSTEASAESLFDKLLEDVKAVRIAVHQARIPEDAPEREQQAKKRYEKEDSRIDLHLINETKLAAQKLLWEHPMYQAAKPDGADSRRISLLVVGGGRLGMEILRTAMVTGIMDTCSFKAVVVDMDGDRIGQRFHHSCPDLPSHARDMVQFYKADVTTSEFDRVLDWHCRDSNYIVVSTGDDERSMATARFLQRWYARQSIRAGQVPDYSQQIYVAIRSSDCYETMENLSGRDMTLFGCNTHLFRMEELLGRKLDLGAMILHRGYRFEDDKLLPAELCQSDTRELGKAELAKLHRDFKRDYCRLDIGSKQSNQLAALHTPYKIQDLAWRENSAVPVWNIHPVETGYLFREAVHRMKKYKDPVERMEHRRWEVFQALDGWSPFPQDMIEACKDDDGCRKQHKHMTAKLHGCMIPYDDLPELDKKVNDLFFDGKAVRNFQAYDSAICVASLFVWLELVAPGDSGKAILEQIRTKLNGKKDGLTSGDLLELLVEMFPEGEKLAQ